MNPAEPDKKRDLKPRPLKPKAAHDKADGYLAQTGRSALTPAQNRRMRKTDNRAAKVARQQKGGRKR